MSEQQPSVTTEGRALPRSSCKDSNHRPLTKRRCISPIRHPYIQKNLDKFKDTFQKPSQIYKFLRESWKTNPLYLTRTLSYISKHRQQTLRKRIVDIDSIAKRLLQDQSCVKLENGQAKPQNQNDHCDHNGSSGNNCDYSNNGTDSTIQLADSTIPITKKTCYFNWICADPSKTSQKTRSFGFICPWCDKDYNFLDSLMAHLKCCHPRFSFNLVEEDGQSVIEMTLNSTFDGSYCGFKYPGHDLRRDFRFTPSYPERRMPLTQIIYFRVKKKRPIKSTDNGATKIRSNNEGNTLDYDDDEADIDVDSGRLYYHTSTCLPVKPNEVDLDSEADMDPDWLRERTQLMIDEFTDVNEGEKEILKLWNLHIMKNYKYKGDNMMRQACLDFVEVEGLTLLSKNLTKNFTLHLANLYDYGLISSGDIIECIRILKKLKPPTLASPTKNTSKVKSERSNEHCQHSTHAKRALSNSHCNQ